MKNKIQKIIEKVYFVLVINKKYFLSLNAYSSNKVTERIKNGIDPKRYKTTFTV